MTTSIHTLYGKNSKQIKPAVLNLFQNNNATDAVEFQMEKYVQDNVDLSTLDPYVICHGSEFVGGLDEVKLTSEVTEDGLLRIYWDITLMTLSSPQTITAQLVFKNDEGAVWTSYKFIVFCNESLTADEEIVAQYPTILKQMETRIDEKTEEATQGAVTEITNNVAGQVSEALERVNQMAEDFDAAVVYIPHGETIPVEQRVNNRLYYQYMNEDKTRGRLEDWEGNVLMSASDGGSGGGLPMFAPLWSDHLYNDASYLRADNFSWHNGSIYVTAYDTLLKEYNNENCVVETENGVTYRRSPNGFKIANADQHDNVRHAYENGGIAWFYVLDTENGRFKLPRTEYGFTGLRDKAGNDVEAGLPNITGNFGQGNYWYLTDNANGAFEVNTGGNQQLPTNSGSASSARGVSFNASRCSDVYGNSDTVQPPATQMYLYFYVGDYERPETEVNIGILTELANGTDISVIVEEINEVKNQAIAEVASYKQPLTTLTETSGEITLEVDKIYSMVIDADTTFSLPTEVDAAYFNQIKVMVQITGTPAITWGTDYFVNKSTPELKAGCYDFYFDYDNHLAGWVVGTISKGEV